MLFLLHYLLASLLLLLPVTGSLAMILMTHLSERLLLSKLIAPLINILEPDSIHILLGIFSPMGLEYLVHVLIFVPTQEGLFTQHAPIP